MLWNQYQSVLIVDNLEETFASSRWLACHQINLPRNCLLSFVVLTYLGHFWLNDGCKQRKYYSLMFTCMSSKAVHIETANSMSILIASYWHWENSLAQKEGTPGSSVLTVMLSHWHQRGVTCILKPSPTCKKSCLFTHISTLEAGSSNL